MYVRFKFNFQRLLASSRQLRRSTWPNLLVTPKDSQSLGVFCGFVEAHTAYSFRRVSSAVVQRYLPQILDASLGGNTTVQNAAVDILGFTIRQGLAHPLQVSKARLNQCFSLTPQQVPANHHCARNFRELTVEQPCEWIAYNPTF
jgi:hypothetical protein